MKKGQRPSKHYRRVRTKKGKKRVHVNPTIKKKTKKRYSKRKRAVVDKKKTRRPGTIQTVAPPKSKSAKGLRMETEPSLEFAGPEEHKRRIEEQARIDALRDFEPFERIGRKFKKQMMPLVSDEEIARIEQEDEDQTEAAAQYREGRDEQREQKKVGKFAFKKIKELISLGKTLEKQPETQNRLDFYDKYHIKDKLAKTRNLVESIGNPKLMETYKELHTFFDKEIMSAKYWKGRMDPAEARLYEAGKLMLETPYPGHIDLTEHALTEKEQQQEAKKMTKTMRELEKEEKTQVQSEKEEIARKIKQRSDLMQATKRAKERAYEDLGMNKEQHRISKEVVELEKQKQASDNEAERATIEQTQKGLYGRFQEIKAQSSSEIDKRIREQKKIREQTLAQEKSFAKMDRDEKEAYEKKQSKALEKPEIGYKEDIPKPPTPDWIVSGLKESDKESQKQHKIEAEKAKVEFDAMVDRRIQELEKPKKVEPNEG